MKFINHLYGIDDLSTVKKIIYLNKLKSKKKIDEIYIIIMRHEKADLLEIVDTKNLYSLAKKEDITIIGLSQSKEKAFQIIEEICLDIFTEFGNCSKDSFMRKFC